MIIRGLKIVTHPDIVNFPVSRRFPELLNFPPCESTVFFEKFPSQKSTVIQHPKLRRTLSQDFLFVSPPHSGTVSTPLLTVRVRP